MRSLIGAEVCPTARTHTNTHIYTHTHCAAVSGLVFAEISGSLRIT